MRKYTHMLDDLIHRRLHVPYTLHVEELRSPKKPRLTLVMLHGIGSSTRMWQKVAATLPSDVRVIAVDLLGFGQSPQPTWATYDVNTQTKSVIKTLVLNRTPLGSILVGHSLGALVAVEVAKALPAYVSELFLISPPVYRPSRDKVVATQREDVLRGVYKIMHRYPKNAKRALLLARRYYVKRAGVNVSPELNIDTFLATLRASIVEQTAIERMQSLTVPTTILSGSRDPLVVSKNLDRLAAANKVISHTLVKKAGHNVVGVMRDAVTEHLMRLTQSSPPSAK